MNIFIPDHLRKVPVVQQLYDLLTEYSSAVYEDGEYVYYQPQSAGSFDNYNYYMNSDPVKKFIMMDFNLIGSNGKTKKEKLEEDGMDYDVVVNYLTTLFYSVKGTKKVPEFSMKYFHLSEFTYNINCCELKIGNDINFEDSTEYLTAAEDFCAALLYFNEFRLSSGSVSLELKAVGKSFVQTSEYGEVCRESFEEIIITDQ